MKTNTGITPSTNTILQSHEAHFNNVLKTNKCTSTSFQFQFKFASTLDKMLILFGTVAAVCGGAALPILMILKGIAVQVDINQLLINQHVIINFLLYGVL